MKYAEIANNHLVLRPHNPAYPVEILPIEKGKTAADYIIGRVCHIGIET
jgi:phosphoketolase